MPAILVVNEDVNELLTWTWLLNRRGIATRGVSGPATAMVMLRDTGHGFNVLITSSAVPGIDGKPFLDRCREEFPAMPVIVVAESPGTLFAAKGDCFGYLDRPFQPDHLINLVALAQQRAQMDRQDPVLSRDWMLRNATDRLATVGSRAVAGHDAATRSEWIPREELPPPTDEAHSGNRKFRHNPEPSWA